MGSFFNVVSVGCISLADCAVFLLTFCLFFLVLVLVVSGLVLFVCCFGVCCWDVRLLSFWAACFGLLFSPSLAFIIR